MAPNKSLVALMLAYGASSLFHFAHNATYIDEYPNLPAWLSAAQVWGAWFAVVSIGVVGGVLLWLRRERAGLGAIALWAALGFDGLAHYTRAPFSAHTWDMNLSIWLEVVAAGSLLILVARLFAKLPGRSARARAHLRDAAVRPRTVGPAGSDM